MNKRLLLILLSFLSFYTVKSQINLNNKLSAFWPLDTNAVDQSSSQLNGTLVNSPTLVNDRFNKPAHAIAFNGTNQFAKFGDILDSVFCDSPNAVFTISGWVNPKVIPSGRSVIIGKAAGGVGPYQWYIYLDSDGKLVAALCSKAMGPTDYVEKKSTKILSTNKWSHCVFIFDGNKPTATDRIQIIIDTIQTSTTFSNVGSMGTRSPNTVQELTMAAGHAAGNPNTPNNQFNGAIDEIRIHARALNMDEVKYLFLANPDSALTVNIEDGIDGYWPIDSNVYDYSGNNFHGTLMNYPTYVNDRASRNYGGIHFDGVSQYVRVGDILDSVFCKKPNAVFSISGWVLPDVITGSRQVLISKAAGGVGPYQWYIYIDTDGKLVAAFCSKAIGPTDYVEKKSINVLSTSKWNHFVFNFDGSALNRIDRIQLYTDTVKGPLFTNVGAMGTTAENIDQEVTFGSSHVANNPFTPANQFKGSLDDIRIHHRNLNQKEISYLYNTISPFHAQGLISLNEEATMNVYPNPTSDNLNIQLHKNLGKLSINIYDINGSVVNMGDFDSSNIQLDVSNLNTGIYVIVIKSENQIFKHKIVKN